MKTSDAELRSQRAKALDELGHHRDGQTVFTQLFGLLCAAHTSHPLADRPLAIRSYRIQSRRLRYGAWASAILGCLIFAVLNVLSLDGTSWAIMAGASIVFALFLGFIASVTIGRIIKIDIHEPRTARRAEVILITSGILAIASFAVFCFLRFTQSEDARAFLPWFAMIFESACLVFATTAHELHEMYAWPEDLARRYDDHQQNIELLERRITAYEAQLSHNKEDNHDYEENYTDKDDAVQLGRSAGGKPNGSAGAGKPNGSAADPGRD